MSALIDASLDRRAGSDGGSEMETKDVLSVPSTATGSLCDAFLATISFCGVQFAWALQIGYTSPTLRQLGMPKANLSYAWLAGPISGAIFQPVVGIWSDACTSKFGRRRPFILSGGLFTVVGLLIFSNAEDLGHLLGDSGESNKLGLRVAIISFWILHTAINTAQGPQRALMADTVNKDHLSQGNAFFAFQNGFGTFLGYALGSLCLSSIGGAVAPWLDSELHVLYAIAALIILLTMAITAISAKERQWQPLQGAMELQGGHGGPCRRLCVCCHRGVAAGVVQGYKRLPVAITRAFAVQAFAHMAWYSTFIYASNWIAEEVFGGDPDWPDYGGSSCSSETVFQTGVQDASAGFMIMAVISMVWSLVLPQICSVAGLRLTWATHMLFLGGILICTPSIRQGQKHLAIALLGLLGFPLAATHVIPWSVVTATTSRKEHEEEKALFSTTFHLAQCLPEILVALVGRPIIEIFDGRVSFALAFGGAAAFVGGILCYRVVVPEELIRRKCTDIQEGLWSNGIQFNSLPDDDDGPSSSSSSSSSSRNIESGSSTHDESTSPKSYQETCLEEGLEGEGAEKVVGHDYNPLRDFEPITPGEGAGPLTGPLGNLGAESGAIV